MGKNNKGQNTGKQQPAVNTAKSQPVKPVEKKGEVKTDLKEEKAPVNKPVQEKKAPVTAPKVEEKLKEEPAKTPIPDATGDVESTQVEEVNNQPAAPSLGTPSAMSLSAMMQEGDRMDANHAAIFLDAFERRVSRMKPNQPLTIKMEAMLDYNFAWYAIKLSVQSFAEKKEMNMIVPNEEVVIQDFVDTFASMGVALEQHIDPTDPTQMQLKFKEEGMVEETRKAAEAEIASESAFADKDAQVQKAAPRPKAPTMTEEELNPVNWKSDDEAIKALRFDITTAGESPFNKFLRLLGKIRAYRQNQETDPVKKSTWDTVSLGFLTKDLITLLDKNATIVLNGIVSASVTALKTEGNMIFAHANLRRNMPALSDAEITDLIKAFIDIKHADPSQPIDDDLAVKNGIIAPTRDMFLRIATLKPNEKESVGSFKKALNPLYQAYKEEIGSKTFGDDKPNPDFTLKAANKMIEIRNCYVDKEAAFPLFTAEDWKAVVG